MGSIETHSAVGYASLQEEEIQRKLVSIVETLGVLLEERSHFLFLQRLWMLPIISLNVTDLEERVAVLVWEEEEVACSHHAILEKEKNLS